MPQDTFWFLINLAAGIAIILSISIFIDLIWRHVARPGAKTAFERFFSHLLVSFFFIGVVVISLVFLSLFAPDSAALI